MKSKKMSRPIEAFAIDFVCIEIHREVHIALFVEAGCEDRAEHPQLGYLLYFLHKAIILSMFISISFIRCKYNHL